MCQHLKTRRVKKQKTTNKETPKWTKWSLCEKEYPERILLCFCLDFSSFVVPLFYATFSVLPGDSA